MRIAVISGGLNSDGAERVSALLANYFTKSDYQVLFVAVYSEEKIYKLNDTVLYQYIGDIIYGNGASRWIKRIMRIKDCVEKFKADAVISFIMDESILLTFNKHLKKIFTLRNDPYRDTDSRLKVLMRNFIFSKADSIVFQTEDAKSYFSSKIQKKGTVIYNPITAELPFWQQTNHEKTIITACRLEPQKNLKMLIDAFNIFSKKHDEYILKIFGSGSLKEELLRYTMDTLAQEKIMFMGHSNSIHEEMAKAEIFVLSSDFEGISNSMIEALGIGVPVICTDCPIGGARLFIQSGLNGILTEVGNTEEMSKAMIQLAEDENLRISFSNESIMIRNQLQIEKICSQWEELVN